MCGFAGIFDLNGTRDVDSDRLKRMANRLRHRGPDGSGLFHGAGIGLAHQRLAIIDIAGGHQPFHTASGDGVLSFNGEIYNFSALARDLEKVGTVLRTRSDTEVLAEGLAKHGIRYLDHLNGMFAFAYWDRLAETLFLARDRTGEKPVYYGTSPDGFLVFASEIDAVLASGLFDPALRPDAVSDYFTFGYVPDPKSIYQGIHKLSPGHFLKAICRETPTPVQYWKPAFSPITPVEPEEAAQALRRHIDRAVTMQTISDVPLGAFLSGGIDSSAIVSAMTRTDPGQQPLTCTIGFEEDSHDEREFARQVAIHLGTLHREEVANLGITELIGPVARAFGEPFADSSALPSYIVAALARRHVTVALSGDGGDELFAGYRRYPFFLGEEAVRSRIPSWLRRNIFSVAGRYYPKLDRLPRPLRWKTTLQALAMDQASAYLAASAIMLPAQASSLQSRDLRASLSGYSPVSMIQDAMEGADTDDPLARALSCDMQFWLPGRMLNKVDRASMAHSLEVRPPLLDYQLVEWATSLPSTLKLNGTRGKALLRDAIAGDVPAEVLTRRKQGFGLPVSQWLRRPQNNPLDRLTHSTLWKDCGYIDPESVGTMINEHKSNKRDHGQALWSVIMFDAFLENSAHP